MRFTDRGTGRLPSISKGTTAGSTAAAVSPQRASYFLKEEGGRTGIPRAGTPPLPVEEARQQQRQRQLQRQRPSERRELRWSLPASDNSGRRYTDGAAAAAAGSIAEGSSTTGRSHSSTNGHRRRTRSSSPPIPALSSQKQQQQQQQGQRLSRGGIRRRHSSLGPIVSKRRSGAVLAPESVATASAGSSRELRTRRRRRPPREVSAAVIVGIVAQHAAEDLLSVRLLQLSGSPFVATSYVGQSVVFMCYCALVIRRVCGVRMSCRSRQFCDTDSSRRLSKQSVPSVIRLKPLSSLKPEVAERLRTFFPPSEQTTCLLRNLGRPQALKL